jgi:putative transposase
MSSNYKKGFRSVYRLTAHIVFVTKYRKKAINQDILTRLEQIFQETLLKWRSELLEFNGDTDYVHLIVDYRPDVEMSKLIANLKTVSSRLIRQEYSDLSQKYFDGKPYFWTGAYFVASCGSVTVEQLKQYVEQQSSPSK